MCICAPPRTPVEGVTVYGRSSSLDARRVQSFFEDRGVVFDYIDVEQNPQGADRLVELAGRQESVVVEIGCRIFVGFEPSELESALP